MEYLIAVSQTASFASSVLFTAHDANSFDFSISGRDLLSRLIPESPDSIDSTSRPQESRIRRPPPADRQFRAVAGIRAEPPTIHGSPVDPADTASDDRARSVNAIELPLQLVSLHAAFIPSR